MPIGLIIEAILSLVGGTVASWGAKKAFGAVAKSAVGAGAKAVAARAAARAIGEGGLKAVEKVAASKAGGYLGEVGANIAENIPFGLGAMGTTMAYQAITAGSRSPEVRTPVMAGVSRGTGPDRSQLEMAMAELSGNDSIDPDTMAALSGLLGRGGNAGGQGYSL